MSYYALIIKWMEKPPIYYFQNCRSINWFARRETDRRRLISPLKQKQIYVFFSKRRQKFICCKNLLEEKENDKVPAQYVKWKPGKRKKTENVNAIIKWVRSVRRTPII